MSQSKRPAAFELETMGVGGRIVRWKASEDQELGHALTKFSIQALGFSADDTLLAAGSHDGTVFLYAV